jgi:hypothetical protein
MEAVEALEALESFQFISGLACFSPDAPGSIWKHPLPAAATCFHPPHACIQPSY